MVSEIPKTTNSFFLEKKKIIIGTSTVLLLSGLSYIIHISYKRSKRRAEYANHYHLDDHCILYLDEFKSSKTKSITRKILRYIIAHDVVQKEDLENELRIPLFKDNIKHVIQQIKKSKQPKRILLFESPPGFGVRYSILNWCIDEHQQNKIILNLDLYDYFSMVYQQNQNYYAAADKEQFIYAILNIFGYFSPDDFSNKHIKIGSSSSSASSISSPCLSEESYSNLALSEKLEEKLEEIENVLKIIKSKSKPVTLVIRNINLLFNDTESDSNSSNYSKTNEIFEWLLKNEKEGLLEVILCNSSNSVLNILKKFKGYEENMDFKTFEYLNPKAVQKYLVDSVNIDLIEKYKFNKDSASKFVQYFSSNFNEIEDYCQSNITVEKLISIRREEYNSKVKKFFKSTPGFDPMAALADPYVTPPIEHLKDCILEMMMKDGKLSVKYILPSIENQHISLHEQNLKYELIMKLIKKNIFKWETKTESKVTSVNSILNTSKMAILSLTASVAKASITPPIDQNNTNPNQNNNSNNNNSSLTETNTETTLNSEKEILNTKDNNIYNSNMYNLDNYNNSDQSEKMPTHSYQINYADDINNINYFEDLSSRDINKNHFMSFSTSQSMTPTNEWKDYIPNTVKPNNYINSYPGEIKTAHEDIWIDARQDQERKKETEVADKSSNYEITFYNLFIREFLEQWFNNIL